MKFYIIVNFFLDKFGDNMFENLCYGFIKLCNCLVWNFYFEIRFNKIYGRIF